MKVFLIAGEASGDVHGYNLINELKYYIPDMELYGTGGEKLASLGQRQLFNVKEMAIIGFDGVIKKLPFIFRMFREIEKAVKNIRPDLIIYVDYPGFNLRMAKRLNKYFIPTVYFIAPQFWVWHYSRIYKLRDYCDLTISIYPFETEDLKKAGVNSCYVGNPVIDNFKYSYSSKADFCKACGFDAEKPIIGILPGSRLREINSLMDIFHKASEHYKDKFQFVASRADNIPEELIKKYAGNIPCLSSAQYDIMKYSDFLWACSGTVTLESAILEKPMIIVYTSSRFNAFIARRLSRLRMIGLPNIIAGRLLVPEVVEVKLTPEMIINATEKAFSDIESIKEGLSKISAQFTGMTPCKTAAEAIVNMLNDNSIIFKRIEKSLI